MEIDKARPKALALADALDNADPNFYGESSLWFDSALSDLVCEATDELRRLHECERYSDAFRLASKLQLTVQIGRLDGTVVVTSNNDSRVYAAEMWAIGDEPYEATRRAIIRAAAAIDAAKEQA